METLLSLLFCLIFEREKQIQYLKFTTTVLLDMQKEKARGNTQKYLLGDGVTMSLARSPRPARGLVPILFL